jgi:flagellar biosynthesis protein FliP
VAAASERLGNAGRRRRRARLAAAAVITFATLPLTAASSASSAVAASAVAASASSAASSASAASALATGVAAVADPSASGPTVPDGPAGPSAPASGSAGKGRTGGSGPGSVSLSVPGQPSQVVSIILLVTVLGVAPAVLLMCTAFTKIVVVLSLVRSAIGTQSVPPNQVLVGLALFLALFVMGPTFDAMQSKGLKPYLDGTKTSAQAFTDGAEPLRQFMLAHTRGDEIALMTKAAGETPPATPADVDLRTLIPAFVLSELRAAFIIGFVVFVPFLVVDIVVSAVLMSLGMVMLPPSLISLPFKLLLFVLVDGWSLVVTTLLGSYH